MCYERNLGVLWLLCHETQDSKSSHNLGKNRHDQTWYQACGAASFWNVAILIYCQHSKGKQYRTSGCEGLSTANLRPNSHYASGRNAEPRFLLNDWVCD